MKTEIIDGIEYTFEYCKELSQRDYTQKTAYLVYSENKDFESAHKDIKDILRDGSWTEEEYHKRNKEHCSLSNGLHTYHTFEYNEQRKAYIYTFVRPYDD